MLVMLQAMATATNGEVLRRESCAVICILVSISRLSPPSVQDAGTKCGRNVIRVAAVRPVTRGFDCCLYPAFYWGDDVMRNCCAAMRCMRCIVCEESRVRGKGK